MPKLKDIVAVCKSKNAGPFELTIDAVFSDLETFEKVKATGVICRVLDAAPRRRGSARAAGLHESSLKPSRSVPR